MSAPAASRRSRLTVAILARDAEHLLVETLDTATQIADEIIVCDTGSTDATQEIARRHGAVVLERPWNSSFAEARNATWETATGDWVLWLDAGERLTSDAARSLRTFVDSQSNPQRAYVMVVMVPPAPNNISGEQVGRIRLVPNRKDLRFLGRVRETLKPAITKAGLEIDGLPWRILRSEQDNDPQIKWNKAARDLKLLDIAATEEGQTPELLVALGEALTVIGDPAGAVACFRKAIQTSERGSASQREAYYGLLTALDANGDQRQQQIAVCLESLERFPLDAQLLCAMGGYLQAEGRIDMAVRAYQTAFEYGQIDPEIWHVPDIFEIAAACLCLAHQLLNNDEGAQKALEQALARTPSATRLRRLLIDLHVKHDRRKEALAEFDLLPPETPNREALRSAIRGACLASRQNWTPALAYLQTAFRAGCRDALCLRWLTIALLSTSNNAEAIEVLETWKQIDPRSPEAQRYWEEASGLVGQASVQYSDDRTLRFDAPTAGQSPTPAPNLATLPTINIYGPGGVK